MVTCTGSGGISTAVWGVEAKLHKIEIYEHAIRRKLKTQPIPNSTIITGAKPKAGTSHKMQMVSVLFSMLHC